MKRLWLRFLAFAVVFSVLTTPAYLLGLLARGDNSDGGRNEREVRNGGVDHVALDIAAAWAPSTSPRSVR